MLLAINANNTNTVFAVYDGATLRGAWRCATDPKRTADEYVVWLTQLMGFEALRREDIDAAPDVEAVGLYVFPGKDRVVPEGNRVTAGNKRR